MSSRSAKEFEEFARGGTGRQARASGEIDQPGGMDASGDDDEPMRRAVAGVPRIRLIAPGGRRHQPRRKRRARVHAGDVVTHHHGDRRSGASAGGVDLRYAPVVAQKAGTDTSCARRIHARAVSGGRQGGKAGGSRQGVGPGKAHQPTAAPAIGRRWQAVRPFRYDSWLRRASGVLARRKGGCDHRRRVNLATTARDFVPEYFTGTQRNAAKGTRALEQRYAVERPTVRFGDGAQLIGCSESVI
jgi:hypothetical protein